MGVANWYVAFHYPTETWVNFKVWGGMGLFLLFALAQGIGPVALRARRSVVTTAAAVADVPAALRRGLGPRAVGARDPRRQR